MGFGVQDKCVCVPACVYTFESSAVNHARITSVAHLCPPYLHVDVCDGHFGGYMHLLGVCACVCARFTERAYPILYHKT